ncbi:zinc finger protein basonuclin-2 [Caerostris extrusa]|uniref:Zinc finger protein basonuclin-2 n=1 Tax=Caerostris extrusa TaxID=172846 RepID=A0AAV4MYH9_CAEEX|nr:zinc finger protein basonuclin-2 [Caerostris extrusa]
MKENDDMCENPLRHLESLSLGAFTNMMNVNNRANFNHRGTSVSSGVSYHAPGLGLGSVTTTTAPNRVESPWNGDNAIVSKFSSTTSNVKLSSE